MATPANRGKAWTKDEDILLTQKRKEGLEIDELAESFQRSTVSIQYRLWTLGSNMLAQHKSMEDVTKELDITEEEINNFLEERKQKKEGSKKEIGELKQSLQRLETKMDTIISLLETNAKLDKIIALMEKK